MSRTPARSALPAALVALLSLLVTLIAGTPAHAEGAVPARAGTVLRISAPATAAAGTSARVYARLLDATGGVPGARVVIQRQAPSGWVQVGTLTTGAGGRGSAAVRIGGTHHYRAYFGGAALRAAATSRAIVISAGSTLGERALAEVRRHKGAPYAWGATGPRTFDCSGLTVYVFRRLGHPLPRTAAEQAHATRRVADSAKRPGDLIFTFHGSTIGHVGIYAGGSQMWAAVQTGDVVRLQSFSGRAYVVGRVV